MAKTKTKKKDQTLQIITRSRRSKGCPERPGKVPPVRPRYESKSTLAHNVGLRSVTRKFSTGECETIKEAMEWDSDEDTTEPIHVGTKWEVLPSIPLHRVFSHLKRSERHALFLVSRYWNYHLRWAHLWRNYDFIVSEKEEIPIKAWKNCNQFLTHYGQHVRHLKIRFDFDPENRPIHNIQNFLSIFKVIMTKLVRKQALIETIDISDFKFAYNECWEATVARSWATRREYATDWTDYSDIFNNQLYTFLFTVNRSRLRSIKMRNMRFNQFDGLQVIEGYTRPCEEDLARYDIGELDLMNFFAEPLSPGNQSHLCSQIEVLAITVFRVDGDLIDASLLRALGNGSGRSLEHLEIEVRKPYRDAKLSFPVNPDGTHIEPIDWSFIESRCANLKLTVNFTMAICDYRSANIYVAHFIKNSSRIHALHFHREDVRKLPASYLRYGRYPDGSGILWRNVPRHFNTLKHLSIDMVDHGDAELELFFMHLIERQTHLIGLKLTAFLTRPFSLALMSAIRSGVCPLKSLFLRAYSFESDRNFISKTLLNKDFADVINSLDVYDVVSYSRPDRLRSGYGRRS